MLMRFSVNNFLSFNHDVDDDGRIKAKEFHMYAGRTEHFKDRITKFGDRRVLKFSSIYGANAAGKSNLITAMDCGKRIILSGIQSNVMKKLYCRNSKDNIYNPTLFEYEFSVGGRCFAFGFTVNLWNQKIITEWLTELENTFETTIYERNMESSQIYYDENYFTSDENMRQFDFFIKDANRMESTLLLYELNRRKLKEEDFRIYNEIFDWFRRKLIIVYPDTRISKSYFRFGSDNKKLVKVLEYLDTGITGYTMQDINENAFREYFSDNSVADKFLHKDNENMPLNGKSVLLYGNVLFELEFAKGDVEKISKLLFKHDDELFEYGEESDGTQRLIELLEIILNDDEEKTFVIDELDRSLHPQMTRKFVETFFEFSHSMKTQLIATTHESNLMDLSLLRRDEIWFAERDVDHATVLYPLEIFKTRYDKVVSKAYLSGRYGAVPVFKDFKYVWGRNEDGTVESEDS